MNTCDYCGEISKIVYTCKYCNGKFCKTHKKPHQHNCLSIVKPENSISQTQADIPKSPVLTEENLSQTQAENSNLKANESKFKEIGYKYKTPLEFLFSDSITISSDSSQKLDSKNSIESSEKKTDFILRARRLVNSLKDKTDVESTNQHINNNYNLNSSENRDQKKSFFRIKLILITMMIVSIALNGFLYTEYQDYQQLNLDYIDLHNNTIVLQSYYEKLNSQYAELRQEYSQINDLYKDLLTDHNKLEDEHYSVMSYQMNMILEEGMNITIEPKENYTILYKLPFTGILNVSYIASGDVYMWIGSNELNEYYSRFPHFPETASKLDFSVPVYHDLIIYFANPNEYESISLTYSLDFIY